MTHLASENGLKLANFRPTSPMKGAQQTFVRMQATTPMMAPRQKASASYLAAFLDPLGPLKATFSELPASMDSSFITGMAKATVHAKKIP